MISNCAVPSMIIVNLLRNLCLYNIVENIWTLKSYSVLVKRSLRYEGISPMFKNEFKANVGYITRLGFQYHETICKQFPREYWDEFWNSIFTKCFVLFYFIFSLFSSLVPNYVERFLCFFFVKKKVWIFSSSPRTFVTPYWQETRSVTTDNYAILNLINTKYLYGNRVDIGLSL